MNKITTVIGLSFAIFFLVGLATTLTRSMMITFWDVLPVYILMGIAIFMMLYEAFFGESSLFVFSFKYIKKKKKYPFVRGCNTMCVGPQRDVCAC